jgi:hypothetical protein
LLASCASQPDARPAESPWASLPSDGDLYLYADVRQTRSLLEPLAAAIAPPRDAARRAAGRTVQAGPLLERSEEAYACLHLPAFSGAGAAGEPAAGLALTGRWSPDLVSLRLSFSCGWVRHEPPTPPYWSARRGGLEVGSPAPGLLLAAAGRPGALAGLLARGPAAGPVESARASDARVAALLAGAAWYAFLPSLAPDAGGEARGLPLRELWLAGRREGDRYELGARAALAGAPEQPSARALAGLVRLAAAAWLRKAGIPDVAARLREMEIAVEAGSLEARGLRLSEAELRAALASWLPAAEDRPAHRGD